MSASSSFRTVPSAQPPVSIIPVFSQEYHSFAGQRHLPAYSLLQTLATVKVIRSRPRTSASVTMSASRSISAIRPRMPSFKMLTGRGEVDIDEGVLLPQLQIVRVPGRAQNLPRSPPHALSAYCMSRPSPGPARSRGTPSFRAAIAATMSPIFISIALISFSFCLPVRASQLWFYTISGFVPPRLKNACGMLRWRRGECMEHRQFESMLAVARARLARHAPEDIAEKPACGTPAARFRSRRWGRRSPSVCRTARSSRCSPTGTR